MSEPMLLGWKRCRKCDAVKLLEDFHLRSESPDGRRNDCRDCYASYQRQYSAGNPEKRRKKYRLRVCVQCACDFRGAMVRCRDCRTRQRECRRCGKTFSGAEATCKPCQRKDRRCSSCGRSIRGTNTQCNACLSHERQCADCGRVFAGFTRRCGACRSTERQCAECGKSFKGSTRHCAVCQKRERECSTCGKTFNGTKSRCSTCMDTDRECVGCGRVFRGHQRYCFACQAIDRECPDCGRVFRGHQTRCSSCKWLALPLEVRIAKAQRWHGRRRARKLDAQVYGPVPVETYAAVLASGLCSYCGAPPKTVDHITPLSRGGVEHESNLTPACKILQQQQRRQVAERMGSKPCRLRRSHVPKGGCCTCAPVPGGHHMITESGCMLAYPLSQYRCHLLPRVLRFTTGTRPETLIVDPLLIGALACLTYLAVPH